MKRYINIVMIEKLAGYGPRCTEPPTKDNLEQLANPQAPLVERIRLLQAIIGGPLHYEEAAAILDEDTYQVFFARLVMGENPRAMSIPS